MPISFSQIKRIVKINISLRPFAKKKKGYNVHLIMILSVLKTHNNSPCSVLLNTIKEQLKAGH